MTLKLRIQVPRNGGDYEARVSQGNGAPEVILAPGDEMELYVYDSNQINITEAPAGTKDNHTAQARAASPAGG